MTHLHQRKEKNCLNCGTHVIGHYCHNCGQENIEPKESVWHLVSHFFQDMTHFDGKFFTSLKDLIVKPGFLSNEYKIGRRVRYLNPIRMYLFTSAIFFLIFFSLYSVDEGDLRVGDINGKTLAQIKQMDSASFAEFTMKLNGGQSMGKEDFKAKVDSMDAATFALLSKKIKDNIGLSMKINIVKMGEIPRSEGGKLSRIVDLRATN